MLQKIVIGKVDEEVLTINQYQNNVYIETLHYMYILETESEVASKKILEQLSEIYMTYRLQNPNAKIDLYTVLGQLKDYKFICTETHKYNEVSQILLPNGLFTIIKTYTDGNYIYMILDGYTFSYISLQFEESFKKDLENIVSTINRASKESKMLQIKPYRDGYTLDVHTINGVIKYSVTYSIGYK